MKMLEAQFSDGVRGKEGNIETYARLMNCRVFRAQTASKAIANWKTL